MKSHLPTGKIDPGILGNFLSQYTRSGNRVVIGAGIGEDATIIDMGTRYLIAKTDPITHVTNEIGYYAVNINANDIAAMGGTPLWFLATILMPESSNEEDLKRVFGQLSETCEELGVVYCGGHTEITSSVNNTVVIGQMLGEVAADNLKPSSGAREGDHLILTKTAAIEGTSIIAMEKEKELYSHFQEDMVRRAKAYLHNPGISVVKEGGLVSGYRDVHALHDPTEGGISTGIFEMATASNLGVEIRFEDIPITKETKLFCDFFGVDPLGTFASGSLLIAVSAGFSEKLIDLLKENDIMAVRIGSMLPKEKGMIMKKEGETMPLPVYHQDELSKIFG